LFFELIKTTRQKMVDRDDTIVEYVLVR